MRVLLIGRGSNGGVESAHLEPFSMYRGRLRQELGVRIERVDTTRLEEVGAAIRSSSADVAMVMTSWRETAATTIDLFRRLHERRDRPRIVYLDSFDPTASPFFGILPYVDMYLKKQLLRDLDGYQRDHRGGFVVADMMAERHGLDLGDWNLGSKIPEGCASQLKLGWNIGVTRWLQSRLKSRWRPRKIHDIFCRVSLGVDNEVDWYQRHRLDALRSLVPLTRDCQVLASGSIGSSNRTTRRRYYREMSRSRIVFSPFGWGEVCWRDYEAVSSDCLLVKPSMDHLITAPNIFVPGETYVPVRWDLSDVEEKCRYYLEHPDEAARIVAAARRAYEDYFHNHRFVDTIREVLAGVR